ncbi:hypothetical protein V6N12_050059 [Hibiscus sabdariffa]|uniref:RNase H type-1 domain-containing protein n=1 Tax=Hibiscus sabdariffa TaxID=183260 RepID=A0ABR2GBA4_9ROSI
MLDTVGIGQGDAIWATRFVVFCWLIWKRKCNVIFNNNPLQSSALIRYGNLIANEFAYVHNCIKDTRIPQPVSWCPPATGWLKANCDGAVNPRDGKAAIGGVVRDEQWLVED